MLVALIAYDKPDALQIRKDTREQHLKYIEDTGIVQQAGPLLDDAGEMIGSLIVLDCVDLEAAAEWSADDPYCRAGLFRDVQLVRWNRVVG